MPILYIVPTPIGNLEDITLRALRVLREADLIAAEDTRVTRKLLARYSIATPTTAYHEHNRARKTSYLLGLLPEKDIALVSDAGTPAINDPGQELVAAAASAGFDVVALPGASAVTTAIAVSGVPSADGFVYLGYLPARKSARAKFLSELAAEPRTLVAFETPHRLAAALSDILDALGDRPIAVCRELTKLHEEVFRGGVSEAITRFANPRGEFTLVIEGASDLPPQISQEEAREILSRLKASGLTARDAISQTTAATGLSRRELYSIWLSLP